MQTLKNAYRVANELFVPAVLIAMVVAIANSVDLFNNILKAYN